MGALPAHPELANHHIRRSPCFGGDSDIGTQATPSSLYLSDGSSFSNVMSYYGWLRPANAGQLFLTHVTPDLRRRILLRCGPTLKGVLA